MVEGVPHGPEAVRGVITFLLREFHLHLPASLRLQASVCDVDGEENHSSSELLCVMTAAVDGHVPRDVLEKLVAGCA
eukprot:7387000-Prymnesium_polylepis.2